MVGTIIALGLLWKWVSIGCSDPTILAAAVAFYAVGTFGGYQVQVNK